MFKKIFLSNWKKNTKVFKVPADNKYRGIFITVTMPARQEGSQRVWKDGIAFMEIKKYGSVMSAYAKTAYEPPKTKRESANVKNTDKAEFSSASKSEGAVASAKASVKMSVESFASPETIAALKSMIADGSYDIPAESVAASILG